MRKDKFKDVVDCEAVLRQRDKLVFAGKHPWIFTKDEKCIGRIKQITRAWDMVFLADETVFMVGSGDRSYHYVSLKTGELLWSIPQKGKRNFTPSILLASPDGQKAYYLYSIQKTFYMDILDPKQQTCVTVPLPLVGMWPILCAFVNREGNVTIVRQNLEEKFIDKYDVFRMESFHRDTGERCRIHWRGKIYGWPVEANEKYILLDDLTVVDTENETVFSLVEDRSLVPQDHFVFREYDAERKLLNITYLCSGSTIIIDCGKREIVAHYCPITDGFSWGCLMGDEFWIGTDEGIVKRPFPHKDPYPSRFLQRRES